MGSDIWRESNQHGVGHAMIVNTGQIFVVVPIHLCEEEILLGKIATKCKFSFLFYSML